MIYIKGHFSKIIFIYTILIGLYGLNWGLPTIERLSYFSLNSLETRSLFRITPLESLHPDEGNILNALTNMNPSKFDFNPRFYNYPSLHIYITGLILKISQFLNIIEIKNDKDFYLNNIHEIATIFYIARMICVLMSGLTAVLLFQIVKNVSNTNVAMYSSMILSFTPLWVRNLHFMQPNIPVTFWITLTIYFLINSIKQNSRKYYICSALTSGLSLSTKYTALPFIFFPVFFYFINQKKVEKITILLLTTIPILTFFLTSPYVILSFNDSIANLIFESKKLNLPSLLYLFESIIVAYGSVTSILIFIGSMLFIKKDIIYEKKVILFWFLSTSIVVFISPENRLLRYLIPVLPVLSIFFGLTIEKIRLYLLKTFKIKKISNIFIIIFFLQPLLYSSDILIMLNNQDIRLECSNWIKQKKQNEVIGIINYIYFDMPIINSDLNEILPILNLDSSKWPKTLIFSSSPSSKNFLDNIPNVYHLEKKFSQRPSHLWTYPFDLFFEDWQYTFLDIYVFQK